MKAQCQYERAPQTIKTEKPKRRAVSNRCASVHVRVTSHVLTMAGHINTMENGKHDER